MWYLLRKASLVELHCRQAHGLGHGIQQLDELFAVVPVRIPDEALQK